MTNLKKIENKWISTGKTGVGKPTLGKEKTNGLVQVKTGVGGYIRKRENKWISTGKNRGVGTNLRKRENKWISTCKKQGVGRPT